MDLADLERQLKETRIAKEELKSLRTELELLKAELGRAHGRIKDLRAKCAVLERMGPILNAEDEQALFKSGASISYRRKLGGGRFIRLRASGKVLFEATGPEDPSKGDSLTKKAVTALRKRTEDRGR